MMHVALAGLESTKRRGIQKHAARINRHRHSDNFRAEQFPAPILHFVPQPRPDFRKPSHFSSKQGRKYWLDRDSYVDEGIHDSALLASRTWNAEAPRLRRLAAEHQAREPTSDQG
jgi:hypothetical protein